MLTEAAQSIQSPHADISGVSPKRAGVLPLSLSQEGLWFFEQSAPGTATYNLAEAWRLVGPLSLPVLRQSLNEIVKRHEPLRTAFGAKGGIPFQIVLPPKPFPLALIDLRNREDRETEASRLAAREAQSPFDLTREPLARARLFRLADEDHMLVINMHHLISDAWSVGVFLRELAALYAAGLSGKSSPLQDLPIQYTNFALWQREMWQGGYLSEHLDYWNRQLQGSPATLTLPVDRSRPAVQSHRGASLFVDWPGSLLAGLRELGHQEKTTVFPILLAAFQVLLQRYTRQDDIVVGSPFTGREQVETEQLIGMFVNTHTLRSDLSRDPAFGSFLRRVRDVTLDGSQHQEIPLHHVVRALGSERNLASHALFQVVFGLQEDFTENWALPGMAATRLDLDSGCAKFEWTVLVTETSRGLRARFEYNTDLFDAGTVTRAARQYGSLLNSIVASPRRRISEFAMATPGETQTLLARGVPQAALYERDKCVHEILQARATENPASVALSMEGRQMTYSELERAADRLAERLQASGVEPATVVGLCLERSMEMIVAMLAILKAGAAYLPLDCAYPRARLAFIIEDAGARFVVTRQSLKTALPVDPKRILCVEDATPLESGAPRSQSTRRTPQATDAAYVMYTSGSTGQPKGAIIPHRAIARLVRNAGYIEFSARDIFLQFAPITFDASTFEIWGALLNGAKLVVLPPRMPSLEELGRSLQRENVTTLWLTAGCFNQMVDFHPESLRGLRWLLAGGEALSVPHVLKALAALENGQLINGYGPTENTTFTCCYAVPKNWSGGASVPIGHAINNTKIYVLDPRRNPVPVGVPGELYAGGDGLALGYANRDELTAERFVASPFGAEDGRLYRTGDLVRWREDGELEFIGRLDSQIKVRGFRVEPGEVIAALLNHPDVREAAVTAWTDPATTKQLAAYLVPRPGQAPSCEALREFLAARLPAHMIPSHFVQLKSLPLTRNGKVDQSALPAPKLAPASEDEKDGLPQNPTEAALAEIWAQVLGRDRIGMHENFFNLGGHSLLATQIISRVAQKMGVELPVQVLFEAPTLAALAEAVTKARSDSPELAAIPRRKNELSPAEKLLAQLDGLSDSQVEELLVEFEDP